MSPTHRHQREWRKLSADERAAWAGFLRTHMEVVRRLDAELEREHGLPLRSYDVLVQLSLAPGDQMRMSELADAVMLSRAGLTHLVDRLERDGVVERRSGERDTRQVFARVTERGLALLAQATPTHLDGVRARFLDRLSDRQKSELAGAWRAILDTGPRHAPHASTSNAEAT
jgi:DNA-binding MarR family transcriptional regulator